MTITQSMQPNDELAALQTTHQAVLARLARIEASVEAFDISDILEHPYGGDLVTCTRPASMWRELRDALDAG